MLFSLERKRLVSGELTNGFSLDIFMNNIRIKQNMEINAMKTVSSAICFFVALTPEAMAFAAADPLFYGVWSCTMINDGNTINVAEWWQERFDGKGVLTGGAQTPIGLGIRRQRSGSYDLTYADGGKARIEMIKPWMFLRHTAEHRYLCLRTAPQ